MTPFDFAQKMGVPSELLPTAAERLRLADLNTIDSRNTPLARRIVTRVISDAQRTETSRLASVGIRVQAAAARPQPMHPSRKAAKPCPRCGSPMMPITIAGGMQASFCPVDKVTMP